MALESSVTYPADLDPAAPTGAEPKSQGDDHHRNVKKAVKNAFAGFLGAVCVTGTDGGAVNAYTLTPATALPSYSSRMIVLFVPTVTNTGAATLNISGLGASAIKRRDGSDVVSGDLQAGRPYLAIRIGTVFQLSSVTQNYIDQLVTAGLVPGVNNPANAGKFFTTDGTAGSWTAIQLDGRGSPVIDLGNSGTTDQTLTYSASAEGWKLKATGNFNFTTTGWPAGRLAGGLLRLENGAAFNITTTNIVWIRSDGTQTSTFASAGTTLQVIGTNLIALFTLGDGIVYGRVI
jgi:hypothetical protein